MDKDEGKNGEFDFLILGDYFNKLVIFFIVFFLGEIKIYEFLDREFLNCYDF